jgi:ferredoxin
VRIVIDASKCITAGTCVMTAPDLFDQDDEGVVVVLDPLPDDSRIAQARKAANACPAGVIRIEDA